MIADCKICYDSLLYSEDDKAAIIPCGHVFHKSCLINSLKSSLKCPLCRKVTRYHDISHIYLSSTDSGTSTSELLALLQEARLRQKEKHGALEESRKANTFLQEELQRSMALVTTNRFLSERDEMQNELVNYQLELEKMGNENEKLQGDLLNLKKETDRLKNQFISSNFNLMKSIIENAAKYAEIKELKEVVKSSRSDLRKSTAESSVKDTEIDRLTSDLINSKDQRANKDAEIARLRKLVKLLQSPFYFTNTKPEAEIPVFGSTGIPGFGLSYQAAGGLREYKAQSKFKGFGAYKQPQSVISQTLAAGFSGSGALNELNFGIFSTEPSSSTSILFSPTFTIQDLWNGHKKDDSSDVTAIKSSAEAERWTLDQQQLVNWQNQPPVFDPFLTFGTQEYKLLETIGTGTFGRVWLTRQKVKALEYQIDQQQKLQGLQQQQILQDLAELKNSEVDSIKSICSEISIW